MFCSEGIAEGICGTPCPRSFNADIIGTAFHIFVVNAVGGKTFDLCLVARAVCAGTTVSVGRFFAVNKTVATGASVVVAAIVHIDFYSFSFAISFCVICTFSCTAGNFRHFILPFFFGSLCPETIIAEMIFIIQKNYFKSTSSRIANLSCDHSKTPCASYLPEK